MRTYGIRFFAEIAESQQKTGRIIVYCRVVWHRFRTREEKEVVEVCIVSERHDARRRAVFWQEILWPEGLFGILSGHGGPGFDPISSKSMNEDNTEEE
jgi:hypothetical protein